MDKQEEKCDGICYAPDKMCPCVEWCEKIRRGEFLATIMAAFFVVVITMMLLPGMLMLNLADWIYDRLWRQKYGKPQRFYIVPDMVWRMYGIPRENKAAASSKDQGTYVPKTYAQSDQHT